MEHSEALEQEMVERYLLGELLPEDRDAFEEHYFDCTECTAGVRAGIILLESGREVARENKPSNVVPIRSRGQRWLQVAALVALPVLGLENLVAVPRMIQAVRNASRGAVAQTVGVLSTVRSGAEPRILTAPANRALQLDVDLPSAQSYSRYSCTIRGAKGAAGEPVMITAAQAQDRVPVVYPAGVPAGTYQVAVEGLPVEGKPVAIATYRLDVR